MRKDVSKNVSISPSKHSPEIPSWFRFLKCRRGWRISKLALAGTELAAVRVDCCVGRRNFFTPKNISNNQISAQIEEKSIATIASLFSVEELSKAIQGQNKAILRLKEKVELQAALSSLENELEAERRAKVGG